MGGSIACSAATCGTPVEEGNHVEELLAEQFQDAICKRNDRVRAQASRTKSPESRGVPRKTDASVRINVYDMKAWVGALNTMTKYLDWGAFHVGVEVFGEEWCFSADGVDSHTPLSHPCDYVFRETIEMGTTAITHCEWRKLRRKLEKDWPRKTYHLIDRNCASFACDVCSKLNVLAEVPRWVYGAAANVRASPSLRTIVQSAIDARKEDLVGRPRGRSSDCQMGRGRIRDRNQKVIRSQSVGHCEDGLGLFGGSCHASSLRSTSVDHCFAAQTHNTTATSIRSEEDHWNNNSLEGLSEPGTQPVCHWLTHETCSSVRGCLPSADHGLPPGKSVGDSHRTAEIPIEFVEGVSLLTLPTHKPSRHPPSLHSRDYDLPTLPGPALEQVLPIIENNFFFAEQTESADNLVSVEFAADMLWEEIPCEATCNHSSLTIGRQGPITCVGRSVSWSTSSTVAGDSVIASEGGCHSRAEGLTPELVSLHSAHSLRNVSDPSALHARCPMDRLSEEVVVSLLSPV